MISRIALIGLLMFFINSSMFAQKKGKIDVRKKTENVGSSNKKADKEVSIAGKKKTVNLSKKGKSDFFVVEWISPLGNKVYVDGDQVELRLKVISSDPISKKDIIIYKNGQAIGSKSDEVSLFGNQGQTEFTYKNKVWLSEGINRLQVAVRKGDVVKKSKSKFLNKDRKGISSVKVSGQKEVHEPITRSDIFWVSPDPLELNGQDLAIKDLFLKMDLVIQTGVRIDINKIKVIHNNRKIAPSTRAKLKELEEGKYEFIDYLTMQGGVNKNEVYLQLETTQGFIESETLSMHYSPHRPNMYVLAIGTETNLDYTVKDAEDFANLFSTQGGSGGNKIFSNIQTQKVLAENATAKNIRGAIERLGAKYKSGNIDANDVVVLFISSHGFLHKDEFRLQGDDYDPAERKNTSVSYKDDISAVLDDIPCKKLVFIDACHSGGGARASSADLNYEIQKLNSIKKGLTTIVSSRADEESYEDARWQNGAFTESIVEGLERGRADQDFNGIITVDELYDYISAKVPKIVSTIKNKPQHPTIISNELGDIALYIIQ